MSGIFGLWRFGPLQDTEQLKQALTLQASSMCRHNEYCIDIEAFNTRCGLGRIHLDILDKHRQPILSRDGRYALFMCGEFYNQSELCSRFLEKNGWSNSDAGLALALYQEVEWEWLRDANGQFVIAIYDRQIHVLQLVMDRFGLSPQYLHADEHGVRFANEVKAIVADRSVFCRLDSLALQEFFTFGYLLEDRTWIEGVKSLPPASITTIGDEGIRTEIYWSFDEIYQQTTLTLEEASEELGRLWLQSVRRRVDSKRLGLSLSGGLDSRAVLAAIPEGYQPLHTITFGIPNCDDHRFAIMAAKVKKANHHFFPISACNWLQSRPEAVWWTDGHLNLLHMHGIESLQTVREYYDISLHAFAGDLIMGGSYLMSSFLNADPTTVTLEIYEKMRQRNRLSDDMALFDHLAAIAGKYRRTDTFFLQNRVRRFTLNGPLILETYLFDRKVTYDNDLIDFCYSLPDELRYQARVYKKMLLESFPKFYKTIPWQKTGLPISAGRLSHQLHRTVDRVKGIVSYRAPKLGLFIPASRKGFADYTRWTRTEPARSEITSMLLNRNARWQQHLPVDKARQLVQTHMDGRDSDPGGLLLLLTFEIWLQKINL